MKSPSTWRLSPQHLLRSESGLAALQWIGLSAVLFVLITGVVAVFVSQGGSQDVQQAAQVGAQRRIDCLTNNCEPWDYGPTGPRAGAALSGQGGNAGLATAGDVALNGKQNDSGPATEGKPSLWDRLKSGTNDLLEDGAALLGGAIQNGKELLGQIAAAGKDLLGKIGDIAGQVVEGIRGWWNGLPNWAKGFLFGLLVAAGIVLLAIVIIGAAATAPVWLIVGLIALVAGTTIYGWSLGDKGVFDGWQALKWGLLAGGAAAVLVAGGGALLWGTLGRAVLGTAIDVGVGLLFGEKPTPNSVLQTFLLSVIFVGGRRNLMAWKTGPGRYRSGIRGALQRFGAWLRGAEQGKYAPGSGTQDLLRWGKTHGLWPTMKDGAKWLFGKAAWALKSPETIIDGLLADKSIQDIGRKLILKLLGTDAGKVLPERWGTAKDGIVDFVVEFDDKGLEQMTGPSPAATPTPGADKPHANHDHAEHRAKQRQPTSRR